MKNIRPLFSSLAVLVLAGSLAGCGIIPITKSQSASAGAESQSPSAARAESQESSAGAEGRGSSAGGESQGPSSGASATAEGSQSKSGKDLPGAALPQVKPIGPVVTGLPEKQPIAPPGKQPITPPNRNENASIDDPTEYGALRTVKYFIESWHYASATGDTSLFEGTVSAECEFCMGVLDDIKDITATKKTFAYGSYPQIATARVVTPLTSNKVEYEFRTEDYDYYVWTQGVEGMTKGHRASGRYRISLTFNGEHWVVTKLDSVG